MCPHTAVATGPADGGPPLVSRRLVRTAILFPPSVLDPEWSPAKEHREEHNYQDHDDERLQPATHMKRRVEVHDLPETEHPRNEQYDEKCEYEKHGSTSGT